MDVVSTGVFRIPAAKAQLVRGEWRIDVRGEGELVRPRGVLPIPGWTVPATLPFTLHEMYEHLRLTTTHPPDEAAEHLAEHFRRFAFVDLCQHGLPLWHDGRSSSRSCTHPGFVRVADVVAMLTSWDRLADAYDVLVSKRRPLSNTAVTDVLEWPILSDSALPKIVRGELNRDGHLKAPRARQLVSYVIDATMRQSWLRTTLIWLPQRRPELVLEAHTAVALHLADAIAQLGVAAGDHVHTCSFCGQPYTPKRALREGDRPTCRRPECQRERQRLNKQRSRERATESEEATRG